MKQLMTGYCNLPEDFNALWQGRWAGQRCVILANGPSLPHTADLARIDCPIIGINRSYRRHASDIHVVTDKLHVLNYGDQLQYLVPDALRLTRYNAPGCLTPRKLNHGRRRDLGKTLLPNIGVEGWIKIGAGMAALQVAVWLGVTEIIFCGLDLRHPMEHFYYEPQWMLDHMRSFGAESLEHQREYLSDVRLELDRRGVVVISTTMDAGEDILMKEKFDDIWRS